MRKIYNERHAAKENIASDLDILSALHKREALDEELFREMEYHERKEKGVNLVLDYIHEVAKEHWFYMTDLSFDHSNALSCDLLLVTGCGIHTFEINHFEGIFELEDGYSILDGEYLGQNPIKTAQKVSEQIKSLALMEAVPMNLQGAAIFPGPKNQVVIKDEVKGIDIVTSKRLKEYIDNIVREEERYNTQTMSNPRTFSWLARIDRHHPVSSLVIPSFIEERVRKGILCSNCGSFDVKIGDPYISCDCGMHESLEEAIVRTVCEFGVLNIDKNLYPPDLLEFFDYQISMDDLTKNLDKHFTPVI